MSAGIGGPHSFHGIFIAAQQSAEESTTVPVFPIPQLHAGLIDLPTDVWTELSPIRLSCGRTDTSALHTKRPNMVGTSNHSHVQQCLHQLQSRSGCRTRCTSTVYHEGWVEQCAPHLCPCWPQNCRDGSHNALICNKQRGTVPASASGKGRGTGGTSSCSPHPNSCPMGAWYAIVTSITK